MRGFLSAPSALLHELAHGPGWGDELRERIRARTGGRITVSRGALVAGLAALAAGGLIVRVDGEPKAGRASGNPRLTYALTDAGRREVEAQREAMTLLMSLNSRSSPEQETSNEKPPARRYVELDDG